MTIDAKQIDRVETNFGGRLYESLPFAALTAFPFRHEKSQDPDDPDSDWNDHAETLGAATIYGFAMCGYLVTLVFIYGEPVTGVMEIVTQIYAALIGLFGVICFSLMIETDLSKTSSSCRRLLYMFNVLLFVCCAVVSSFPFLYGVSFSSVSFRIYMYRMYGNVDTSLQILLCNIGLLSAAGFYILCAIVYRILG